MSQLDLRQTAENYTAQCPVCFNEWDFTSKREADRAVAKWHARVIALVTSALRGLRS